MKYLKAPKIDPTRTFLAACHRLLAALIAFASIVTPAFADKVTNRDELVKAIANAQPGAEIELSPGTYGELSISGIKGTQNAPIVLRSLDPASPAKISKLTLRETEYLTFQGLTFDYEYGTFDQPNVRPFQVFSSRSVTFDGNVFDGDLATNSTDANGFPTGFGLAVTSSTQVTLNANEIRDFYRGLVVFDVVDLKVTGNDVHSIRMDGMNFAQVENVLIDSNTIRDFKRIVESSDHADMIQFWTNRTERPSKNVVISNNVLNSGLGAFTQSIFMRNDLVDRGLAGSEMYYQNITITENVIVNAHLHGITLGETVGAEISHNTLVYNPASKGKRDNKALWRPQIRIAPLSKNVEIASNIAPKISGLDGQASWQVENNIAIQDTTPSQPNYYDDIFVAALSGDPRELKSYSYLGPQAAGASRLREKEGNIFLPVINRSPTPNKDQEVILSANRSYLPEGVSLEDAKLTWTQDNKVIGTGQSVVFTERKPGSHQVRLSIELPDGRSAQAESSLYVRGDTILAYSIQTNEMVSFVNDDTALIEGLPMGRGGLVFGNDIASWEVRSKMMSPFFDALAFKLSLDLELPLGFRNAGELLRIHQSLVVNLNARGAIELIFNTQDERLKLITAPLKTNTDGLVKLVFDYDSQRGTLDVINDGRLIGRGSVIGRTQSANAWGLGFGSHLNNRVGSSGSIHQLQLSVPRKSTVGFQKQ